MKQGLLAFQYEQEKGSTGMTGLSGLMTYVELMQAAGLRSSVERHVRLRERGQGWTDSQMIISLMLLNLAGGESVSDLDLLEKDRGLCRMLREFETCGMRLSERRALEKRWRVERRLSVPSESAVFRYLERFHEVDEGVEAGSSQSIHTCSQRSYEGSAQGERRPGGLRAEPFASDRGHSGHGCHTGGDAQAGGAPQLQEAQGVPAADHVLVRGRVDRAFGVSGRQRTCGPSAVASVD